MPRQRPTAVLVLAILNLVFGGLGLASELCCLGGLGWLKIIGPAQNGSLAALFQTVPSYLTFAVVQHVLGLILSALLLVSGLGLLGLRNWARWLAIGYSLASVFVQVYALVVQVFHFDPLIERYLMNSSAKGTPIDAIAGTQGNVVSQIAGAFFGVIYPIVLLVLLFLPGVVRAFSRQEPTDAAPTPGPTASRRPRRPRDED
jgi:hypothetical protein